MLGAEDPVIYDPRRLIALRETGLLDSAAEEAFDRLTRLAVAIFRALIALVSLIDEGRQFFKSSVGLPEPWCSVRQTPLSHSFCKHVVTTGKPLVVDNAPDHPLVCDNPAITELGVVAYLGIPLVLPTGEIVGSFCVIDTVPRAWTPAETAILSDLAVSVITEVELRDEVTHRRQAEQRLRLLESAVVHANDAVLITEAEPIDEPGPRIVFANQAFCRMTGYAADEVLGKTPRLLQGPKTDRAQLDLIRHALARWQAVRVELVNYHKDGSEFWVELVIVPLADETGWYTHWVSVQRDITDRKLAEQALRHSEERYRSLALATAQVVWTVDRDGESLDSASWRDFTGQSEAQVRGLGWLDAVHSEDRAGVAATWQQTLGGTTPAQAAFRLRRDDGVYRVVQARAVPVSEPDGSVREWVGTCTDVTESAMAEQAMRESEARNRAVLEAALDCIVTIDHAGRVVEFNPAAEQHLRPPPPGRAGQADGRADRAAGAAAGPLPGRGTLPGHRRGEGTR